MTQSDFFKDITLPALGLTVTLRKVDATSISERAALAALNEGSEAVMSDDLLDHFQRLAAQQISPEAISLLMNISDRTARMLVEASVVDVPAMLEEYRATGFEPDYGMGPDYSALLKEIRQHNGLEEGPSQAILQGLVGVFAEPAKALPKSKGRKR